MGSVWRAEHLTLHTEVAVKFVSDALIGDQGFLARFTREAIASARIKSPHAVQIFDHGVTADGVPYIVMELLEGEDLRTRLLREKKLPLADAVKVVTQVARGLSRAHAASIVHRDIKPGNIFLVDSFVGGGVRLMDFGLAKIAGAGELTQAGMIAGSPSYIAPELWRDERPDHRIDVYSFAAVIFRALAGQPPFWAPSTPELLIQVTTAERPRLTDFRPDMSPQIDQWVQRALALRRDDRYPYVTSMWNDLIRIVQMANTPSGEKARQAFRLP